MHNGFAVVIEAMFKAVLLSSIFAITAAACSDGGMDAAPQSTETANNLPSAAQQFQCLPEGAAFIAAHRGNSKGRGLAENSASGLSALIGEGILFAEIDVSRLKDGTHILFHDGIWDKKSTGRGPIAQSRMEDAQKLLLKDDRDRVTSDRPITFQRALDMARGQLYLEIDFKSSSNEAEVIKMIKRADMEDQVILIAYSQKQAARLARQARGMMISVPVRHIGDIKAYQAKGVAKSKIAAWLNGAGASGDLARELRKRGIPVLAKHKRDQSAGSASLMVTDWAFKVPRHKIYKGIMGLNRARADAYQSCIDR